MKQLFTFLIAAVFVASAANAQSVITHNMHAPQIGDTYTIYYSDSYDYFDPGTGGANQTWDLSGYVTSESDMVHFVDPATTPWGGQATNSNLATQVDFKDMVVIYLNVTSSMMKNTAMGTSAEGMEFFGNYEDEQELMHFPFAYNDNFTDTYSYTFEYSMMGMTIQLVTSGTDVTTADAWGTVSTPYGVFENALRVKTVTTETQETWMNGVLQESTTDNTTNYEFYHSDYKAPLASLYYDAEFPDETEVTFTALATGISEMETADVNVYPNPASEMISIDFSAFKSGSNVSLINAKGAEVARFVAGNTVEQISVSELPQGMYMIMGKGANNQAINTKLVIE